MKPFPDNESCPCESGKKHKFCCKKKNLFFKDIKERTIQQIPLRDEAKEILNRQEENFIKVFGRKPQKNEPIFFGALLMSEDDYYDVLEEMFDELKLPEELLYASRKTGYTISEVNKDMMPDNVLKNWNDAIKEFRDIKKGKKKIQIPQLTIDIEYCWEKLNDLQYLYALLLHKFNERLKKKKKPEGLANDYLLFCFTKNLKTLKTVIMLLDKHFGEDALNLIRSVFENYLHVSTTLNNTEEFIKELEIKLGVLLGTYKLSKNGSSKIVNIKTGEEYILKFNNKFKLASLHPVYGNLDSVIYQFLYDFLSSYTHPDFRSLPSYIDIEKGFTSSLRTSTRIEAITYACLLNILIIHELQKWKLISKTDNRDMQKFISDIKPSLLNVFKELEIINPAFPKEFQERVKLI
ncbi:MAG: hypothetical protein JWP12_2224 [Bacteroidetes bacterium]|nr:hypothetical protein [Bacteroidota bacterium]